MFVATANAVRHAGGYPVALNIDPRYWQLDPDLLERFLARQCRVSGGRLTGAGRGRTGSRLRPDVILLDEPTNDLDLDARHRFYDAIAS